MSRQGTYMKAGASKQREWQAVEHVDPDMVPIPEDVEFDIEHHQVRVRQLFLT